MPEGGALLLALGLFLDDRDTAVAEVYLQKFVQRRHFPAVGGAEIGQIVLSREGLALKPG
ncbi:hypothetical protein ACIQRS_21235 [Streptomyces termitum]|nr:hypothetical protein [Streptomyces termitum]